MNTMISISSSCETFVLVIMYDFRSTKITVALASTVVMAKRVDLVSTTLLGFTKKFCRHDISRHKNKSLVDTGRSS